MAVRVAVVGAGLSGLTVAVALGRAGVDCRVYERASRFREVGSGIQLSPNGSRLLHRLGLGPALDLVTVRPEAIDVRTWNGNVSVARTELGAACARMYGAPYYTVHRADLHGILLEAAGETVELGRRCVGVSDRGDSVELTFSDETTETADVVIGADGAASAIRGQLFDVVSQPVGQAVFRAVVGADRMPELAAENEVIVWAGPGGWCVAYPISAGKAIALSAVVPAGEWQGEDWSALSDVDTMRETYSAWHPIVRELVSIPEEASLLALFNRPELPPWSGNRVMLIGDAAHPMLLYGAQGASQGIEDAVALTGYLRGATVDTVPDALRRYETVRRARLEALHRFNEETERRAHSKDGPQAGPPSPETALRQREFVFSYDSEDLG
jgi:salicylate hydroxylase